ncbi:MAG TPA: glycosyltransferase family 4 protein [Allomuricauda sp.]|nr:glycosyltransferase family 4 protein [Allomuricauda sp.]
MNILLVARWPVGGIRTYLNYIYSKPCFEEVMLTLVAPDMKLSSYLQETGLKNRIAYFPVSNTHVSMVKGVRKALKGNFFDLIHSHGFTAGILTELAMLGKSTKHLMTGHDIFLDKQFQGFKGSVKKQGLKIIFDRIDYINTVSDDARNNLLEYFPLLDSTKIFTIQNGVDTNNYAKTEAVNLRSQLGIPQSKPLIGFFGRFMAQKGFRYLAEAIEILSKKMSPSSMPLVLTFGWGGFIREDYQYLANRGISEHFVQLPHTNEMPAMLKSVDFVVIPSLWEACALLPMEVLAAGTPLIATDCIGMGQIIRNTPAKIIPPASSVELADAIYQYLSNNPTVEFKSFAPKARGMFSSGKTAKALFNKYTDLITTKA